MTGRARRAVTVAVAALVGWGVHPVPAGAAEQVAVSGRITDFTTGAPIAGACVTAVRFVDSTQVAADCAGADGVWTFTVEAGGVYLIESTAAGYQTRWATSYLSPYTRFVTEATTIDMAMVHQLPSVSGVVTDAAGTPVAGVDVRLESVDGAFRKTLYTDAQGRYSLAPIPPLPMRLSFRSVSPIHPLQFAPGRIDAAEAGVFPVGDGQALVVDEKFVPYGKIVGAFTDKTTGAPVRDACIELLYANARKCSDDAGNVTVSAPFGTWLMRVTLPEGYPGVPDGQVVLSPGETVGYEDTVLTRQTSLIVTSRAADSPSWQPPTCVIAVPVEPGVFTSPDQTAYSRHCGSYNSGPIEVWLPDARPVQLFAYSGSTTDGNGPPQYGAQWVGENGGTGERQFAKIFTPAPNVPNTGPRITMDRPGVIVGSIGEDPGGTSCVSAVALPLTIPGDPEDMQVATCTTQVAEGAPRFTLNGLGPYGWPLYVTSQDGLANVWSGGATNRLDAELVYTGAYGVDLPGPGGAVKGTVTGGAGGRMLAYDAVTGDFIAQAAVSGTSFTVGGLNTRPVILQYRPVTGQACWPNLPASPRERRYQGSIGVARGRTSTVTVSVVEGCTAQPRLTTTAAAVPRRSFGMAVGRFVGRNAIEHAAGH